MPNPDLRKDLVAPHQPTSSTQLSTSSSRELRELTKILDVESQIGLEFRMSLEEAQRVFNELTGFDDQCSPQEAVAKARLLLGLYPAREVNNAEVYTTGMAALLAAFPTYAVRKVTDPVNGLPSKLKWLPTLAEVNEALTDAKVKRGRIGRNAEHVIRAHRKREEDRKREESMPSPEERQRQVQELLGRAVASTEFPKT
jgi:hypothetical protein